MITVVRVLDTTGGFADTHAGMLTTLDDLLLTDFAPIICLSGFGSCMLGRLCLVDAW